MSYDAVFDLVNVTLDGTEVPGLVNEQVLLDDEETLVSHPFYPQGITWRDGESGKIGYRCYRNRLFSHRNAAMQNNRQALDYTNHEYFRFRYTDTNVHCSHRHPQLRNLVTATSKNDVYYLCKA
ncbi:hypothetical protein BGZ94_009536 [Podila epigama]|nr:hypothetical protein BGZ94_009536 [Podila epigama]